MANNGNPGATAHGAQWLDVLIESLSATRHSPLGETLPKFPSVEMQQNTTGLSAEAALRQAHAFYRDVDHACESIGCGMRSGTRVLDFGYGWGRISRVFMEKVSVDNIYGVDVDPAFAAMTTELFGSDHFSVCAPFPPTAFADASFDMVIAYSVFSHLSEQACTQWMREFARLVKPGGVVAWTTRHESFFDFCRWAADQGDTTSGYIQALGKLFPNLDDARRRYRDGELVHATSEGVGGGGPRDVSFYGETWIPERYARERFAENFTLVGSYFDGAKYDQACFVFQRR